MVAGLSPQQIDEYFQGSQEAQGWAGDFQSLPGGGEILPFKFAHQEFLLMFGTPESQAGGQENWLDFLQGEAAGFVPAQHSRFVKFCRAKAVENFFDSDAWPLPNPQQVFEFIEVLASFLLFHSSVHTHVTQYYFQPASARLSRMYERVARHVERQLPLGRGLCRLDPLGVVEGYELS